MTGIRGLGVSAAVKQCAPCYNGREPIRSRNSLFSGPGRSGPAQDPATRSPARRSTISTSSPVSSSELHGNQQSSPEDHPAHYPFSYKNNDVGHGPRFASSSGVPCCPGGGGFGSGHPHHNRNSRRRRSRSRFCSALAGAQHHHPHRQHHLRSRCLNHALSAPGADFRAAASAPGSGTSQERADTAAPDPGFRCPCCLQPFRPCHLSRCAGPPHPASHCPGHRQPAAVRVVDRGGLPSFADGGGERR
ncbi:uncharacterized protein B0T15DRAFT_298080 [Chaetomium strumarium]|uniref:Uncharacterized protein n=1 Tax=Chaetomium strumarium TaxID=1170767 RepID=A0AAJ0GLP3_9PEZI|nr:hypothetical protein B0T15DRAFT_298080 [Chaetomium strumarium]